MDTKTGDLGLLEHPVAQELLHAPLPIRLAYCALDGAPRVIPILFHWTGEEIVVTSWPDDPKVGALSAHPQVALTIDTTEFPFKVLSLRGLATVTIDEDVTAACLPVFLRYFGPEGGQAWAARTSQMTDRIARIAIRPTWVEVLDFESRFPSGMTRRMSAAQV
jgi:hypothetical protein